MARRKKTKTKPKAPHTKGRKTAAQALSAEHARRSDEDYLGDVIPTDEYGSRKTGKPVVVHAKQRRVIEEMLAHNIHTSDICEVMCDDPWNMTRATVKNSILRIRQKWREVDQERRADHKLMAQKRLLADIAAARKSKAWNAVASLERLLADIQGTKEPIRIDVDVNETVRESIEVSLANMTPEMVRAFAQRHRERRAELGMRARGKLPKNADAFEQVIDAEAE